MAVSKAEGALYVGGIGALVGTLLFRKRLSKQRRTQTMILGGGLLLTAGAMSLHRRSLPGGVIEGLRGHEPLGLSNTESHDSQGAQLKVWDDPSMTIKQRVHLLQGLVATSVKDPSVRNLALAITGHGPRGVTLKGGDKLNVPGAACPARDDKCEAKAIFDWVANPKNVRYTGDTGAHALSPGGPVEAVDEFQTALRTLQYRGGDCDDHSVLNAALAIKNGFPAKFRITSNSGDSWDHIYAMVGVPKLDPSEWIALDTTLGPGKFNKQPKRAKQIDFAA